MRSRGIAAASLGLQPQTKGRWQRKAIEMTRKANAIPGGGAMPLDRAKKKPRLTPGGGGGGAWKGGKPTASSAKFGGAKVFGTEDNVSQQTGTSIFDPVLCELMYSWFCPAGGSIFDPFAGGSVRGIVAAYLGFNYTGIDLSAAQIQANEQQAALIVPDKKPHWLIGDSKQCKILAGGKYDMVFTCPPYGHLERYSNDPADLSAMTIRAFFSAYAEIIGKSVAMLKTNRFACFVVASYRDKHGCIIDLPGRTVALFEKAGMRLYNDAILLTAIGSLPVRVPRPFRKNRKLGKTHQNVLVFYKGNPKAISKAVPLSLVGELPTKT